MTGDAPMSGQGLSATAWQLQTRLTGRWCLSKLLFLMLWFKNKVPSRSKLGEKRVCLGSLFEVTTHPDGEGTAAGIWGNQSHFIQGQEAGSCFYSFSAHPSEIWNLSPHTWNKYMPIPRCLNVHPTLQELAWCPHYPVIRLDLSSRKWGLIGTEGMHSPG